MDEFKYPLRFVWKYSIFKGLIVEFDGLTTGTVIALGQYEDDSYKIGEYITTWEKHTSPNWEPVVVDTKRQTLHKVISKFRGVNYGNPPIPQ